MSVLDRARALYKLGFFAHLSESQLPGLAESAQADEDWDPRCPATGLLRESGELVEVHPEAHTSVRSAREVIEALSAIIGTVVPVKGLKVTRGPMQILQAEYEVGIAHVQLLLVGTPPFVAVLEFFERELVRLGDRRRLCLITESLDDVDRYVFADPDIVWQAEEQELFAAPDYGDGDS